MSRSAATLPPDRRRALEAVAESIGHVFDDLGLLDRALTHASLGNEGRASYERLEFLGDSILGFLIAAELYRRDPEVPEGELTNRRTRFVSREPLADVSRQLGLVHALEVGRGLRQEELDSPRIQADLLEAVLGAIYIDGGIRSATKFVRRHVIPRGDADSTERRPLRDPKSRLLHLAQSHALGQPRYVLIESEGPDHQRTFCVGVEIAGLSRGIGKARSKQLAEMEAAREAITRLERELAAPADPTTETLAVPDQDARDGH